MNAKRVTTALVIALVISGLFTFWLSRRLTKTAHVATPQKQLYVAAVKALEAGEVLKPGDLQLVEWPLSASLTGGFIKIDDVAGRAVLYPLAKGEPILDRHLAVAGAGVGLSANIPTGMRAISVRSDEVVGVAGFMQPGTHVDVLLTYHSDKSPEPRTATVLQDVVILAVGQQIHPDPDSKPTSVAVVTLLLKPEDAERVVLATSLGAIHFVLRNGADREQTSHPSIGLNELAGIAAPSPSAAGPIAKLPHPKSKEYEVVTILGDKQVVNSFDTSTHVDAHE
jgi:pilus assembly protein CpaB